MVNHMQAASIVMIIHGALTSLMGILYVALGPTMLFFLRTDQRQQKIRDASEETFMTVVSIVYVVLGVLILVVGILNIVGGIRILKFRGRVLALVAVFSNVLALLTCYCLPTGLTVLIYGLIVLFNADVVRAFQMAQAGVSPREIKARFSGYPGRRWEQEDLPP